MKKHPEAFLLRYCLRRANEESGAISNSRHICPTEKTKKDGYVHRNCPFCPYRKAEAVNGRSEARHTLGERKALLMALLSKVLLRYF